MIILYMILIFTAGIFFGYGLRSNIRDLLRSIHYHIWAFWNYKILKRPEPDPIETLYDMMPLVMMAGLTASVASSLNKAIGKEKIEYMAKKKSSTGRKLKR